MSVVDPDAANGQATTRFGFKVGWICAVALPDGQQWTEYRQLPICAVLHSCILGKIRNITLLLKLTHVSYLDNDFKERNGRTISDESELYLEGHLLQGRVSIKSFFSFSPIDSSYALAISFRWNAIDKCVRDRGAIDLSKILNQTTLYRVLLLCKKQGKTEYHWGPLAHIDILHKVLWVHPSWGLGKFNSILLWRGIGHLMKPFDYIG